MSEPERPFPASQVVILPGQEPLIADVFGRGAVLPGNLRWLDGRIDRSEILCRYDTPAGMVVVVCVPRAAAAPDAVLTECFGLTVTHGNPSPELIAAIAERLRRAEAGIRLGSVTAARPTAAFEKHLHAPLELRNGMRILEVGAGQGVGLLELAALARDAGVRAEMVAVDFDTARRDPFTRAATARGLVDMVRFELANAWRLPPGLGHFDVVLCLGCVSFLALGRADDLVSLFRHWSSFMRPDARLVLAEIDPAAADAHQARAIELFEQRKWALLSAAVIEAALDTAGFGTRVATRSLHFSAGSRDEADRYLGQGLPTMAGQESGAGGDASLPAGGRYDFVWRTIEASRPR